MSDPIKAGDVLETVIHVANGASRRFREPVIRSGEREALSEWVRVNVLLRDNYTCRWCFTKTAQFHIDHIIPWSAGGTDATDNLRTLCASCNLERSNRSTDVSTARVRLITNGCSTCCFDGSADDREWWGESHAETAIWCAACRADGLITAHGADSYRNEQVAHTGLAAPHVGLDRESWKQIDRELLARQTGGDDA